MKLLLLVLSLVTMYLVPTLSPVSAEARSHHSKKHHKKKGKKHKKHKKSKRHRKVNSASTEAPTEPQPAAADMGSNMPQPVPMEPSAQTPPTATP